MKIESKNVNKAKAGGIFNYLVFIFNLAVIILLPVVITETRGIFIGTFEKYEVDIPAVTEFFLSVSGSVYFVIFYLIAAALIAKEIFITKKMGKLLINILIAVVTGIIVFVYAASLMITLIRCMQTSIQNEFV